MKTAVMVVLYAWVLAGCAAASSPLAAYLQKNGDASADEVLKRWGPPDATQRFGKAVIWVYYVREVDPAAALAIAGMAMQGAGAHLQGHSAAGALHTANMEAYSESARSRRTRYWLMFSEAGRLVSWGRQE